MEKKKHDGVKNADHHHESNPESVSESPTACEEETPAVEKTELELMEEALAASQTEAKQNWDKFVRERADIENYRKRVQKEKEEILKYGNESFILEILPSIDNLERALSHADGEGLSAVIDGVRLTLGMLQSALKKFGVTPIDTVRGIPFDPAFHQAMQQVECDDLPPNSVVAEFQRGYLLNDRLLRAAMVSVAVPPKNCGE